MEQPRIINPSTEEYFEVWVKTRKRAADVLAQEIGQILSRADLFASKFLGSKRSSKWTIDASLGMPVFFGDQAYHILQT